jgi:hypothetical protein
MPGRRRRTSALAALALAATAVLSATAGAHFALRSPASWRTQDALGNPQKAGPCGNEGGAAATGVVTAFAPGQTITITLDETIFHPGHYRVALAPNDPSELPPEPPVTPGTTDCGSVPIQSPAVFPVLADGMLPHAAPLSGTRSFQVTLPSDLTCSRCTLQVLEFMSDHAAPCFYHHCAEISIGTNGGPCETDADCDDGDACTRDGCHDAEGCVASPITLADVDAGVLGALPSCPGEQIPPRVGRGFAQAEALVVRAAGESAKAKRLLARASKRLRRTGTMVTKLEGRRLSAACAAAVGAVVEGAKSRVQCLLGGS